MTALLPGIDQVRVDLARTGTGPPVPFSACRVTWSRRAGDLRRARLHRFVADRAGNAGGRWSGPQPRRFHFSEAAAIMPGRCRKLMREGTTGVPGMSRLRSDQLRGMHPRASWPVAPNVRGRLASMHRPTSGQVRVAAAGSRFGSGQRDFARCVVFAAPEPLDVFVWGSDRDRVASCSACSATAVHQTCRWGYRSSCWWGWVQSVGEHLPGRRVAAHLLALDRTSLSVGNATPSLAYALWMTAPG